MLERNNGLKSENVFGIQSICHKSVMLFSRKLTASNLYKIID